ncbi:dipeptide epimerase [Polyangium aurulentum]|uniref:dipeptide epimerase n=1 Tax=Polyangium aurulentum TaxID=2567896 RepID=UPI0010AE78F7|nr:dipeptide epimerase [Polyangium aurulentum]UQA58778.1 dipeptide epimerase [Polyangium aurulentum]
MSLRRYRLASLVVRPLSVPLLDPFVIATGRVDATRSAEVRVVLEGERGERAEGLGEGAALWPVTREDQPEVVAGLEKAAAGLTGATVNLPDADGTEPFDLSAVEELGALLDGVLFEAPVARAALETAICDAWARVLGLPLRTLFGGAVGEATRRIETDITIPIAEPVRMAELARGWAARGFLHFKVKVGKDVDRDLAALFAIASAVPGARFRIDANEGFSAAEAIALARAVEARQLVVECYEQPCRAGDLEGMAAVAEAVEPPVIADESVKTLADLERVRAARAADGVNLKLVKSGGPLGALAIGRMAVAAGMPLMVGGMVETRLGMTAAAHVAAGLGGVSFADLDTAWLLAADPYEGGYEAEGPQYVLPDAPGLGVISRGAS